MGIKFFFLVKYSEEGLTIKLLSNGCFAEYSTVQLYCQLSM